MSILECWQLVRSPLPGNRAQLLFDCVMFVLLLAGLAWQRRSAITDVARRQASVLLAPFALTTAALFGIFAWDHASSATSHNPYLLEGMMLLTAALPLGFAAGVGRFRLFDVDALAPRAGVYGLVVTASLLVYAIVLAAADRALSPLLGRGYRRRALAGGARPRPRRRACAKVRRARRRPALRARSRALLARCTELVAQLSAGGAAADVGPLVARALDVRVASLGPLARRLDEAEARRLRAEVRRRGAMRVVEAREPEAVNRLLGEGIEVLVDVPGRDEVLATSSPLAVKLLERCGAPRALAGGPGRRGRAGAAERASLARARERGEHAPANRDGAARRSGRDARCRAALRKLARRAPSPASEPLQ